MTSPKSNFVFHADDDPVPHGAEPELWNVKVVRTIRDCLSASFFLKLLKSTEGIQCRVHSQINPFFFLKL